MPEEHTTQTAAGAEKAGRPTVLVIEDDQFLRDLVAKKLEVSQFVVLQAIDGGEGLAILKDHQPDVILLDMVLPGMSGLEVLQSIKSNPKTRSVPVIILSNLGQKSDIEKAKELGAAGYMVKAHTDLNDIVKTIITTHEAGKKK